MKFGRALAAHAAAFPPTFPFLDYDRLKLFAKHHVLPPAAAAAEGAPLPPTEDVHRLPAPT